MKEQKDYSFFKKLVFSIKDIEKYPELASRGWLFVFSYLVKVLAIFAILVSFAAVYTIAKDINKAKQLLETEIPNFTFEESILKVDSEKPIIIEDNSNIFKIIIMDSKDLSDDALEEYKLKLQGVDTGIICTKNSFLLKTQITNNISEYSYSQIKEKYKVQSFNKQDFLKCFSGINLILIYIGLFIISFIYLFVNYILSIWLDVILLGIFGFITALIMRLHLRFSAMCKIAVHSLTLPILLNAVAILLEAFTGFTIKYFEVMYVTIAYIYIVASILIIKSDVIKNQQELQRIIDEQEKVREEIQKQDEEQKEEKEQNDEDNKNNDNNEEKNDDVNDEPQGDNA